MVDRPVLMSFDWRSTRSLPHRSGCWIRNYDANVGRDADLSCHSGALIADVTRGHSGKAGAGARRTRRQNYLDWSFEARVERFAGNAVGNECTVFRPEACHDGNGRSCALTGTMTMEEDREKRRQRFLRNLKGDGLEVTQDRKFAKRTSYELNKKGTFVIAMSVMTSEVE